MERNIDMAQVSDGRFYTSNDLVKTDCGGCQGCSACCHGMGTSITLDPMDIYRLCSGLGIGFEELMVDKIELNIVDSLILPNLKMTGAGEACVFLDGEGRCSIHSFRPGICRLFPLGRFYEKESFQYFLQVHECPKPNKSKVKVKKWVDTPDLKTYEQYICDWHYYLKRLQRKVEADAELMKEISMELLKRFYVQPYHLDKDFYVQFYGRLHMPK